LSYLSPEVSVTVARLVRDVLERSKSGRGKGRANIRAAAHEATKELARRVRVEPDKALLLAGKRAKYDRQSPAQIEAHRRLLHRLAYAWRPGERLQSASRNRVASLLECIETGAGHRCMQIGMDATQDDALSRWATRTSWLYPASDAEWSHLLPVGRTLADRRTETGHLPEWIVREIKDFRQWAKQCGHTRHRTNAAIKRFLAPFCAYDRTEGVEMAWTHLSSRQLASVVRHGLLVERLWIGTESASRRVSRQGLRSTDPSFEDILTGIARAEAHESAQRGKEA